MNPVIIKTPCRYCSYLSGGCFNDIDKYSKCSLSVSGYSGQTLSVQDARSLTVECDGFKVAPHYADDYAHKFGRPPSITVSEDTV